MAWVYARWLTALTVVLILLLAVLFAAPLPA